MTQTARLYGGSLYDLAAEEQMTEVLMEQLTEVRRIFGENPEYVSLLSEPSIPFSERKDMIEAAFGSQAERYLVNFLKLLCEKNLLREFSNCCEEYTRRYYADHGIAEAVVVSAVALKENQLARLKEKLEQLCQKQISLVQKIDPSVVGGLRVEVDGKQYDGTIQGRMSELSGKIKNVIV
jgi:F-type H+-transporting ATPase subunit delta